MATYLTQLSWFSTVLFDNLQQRTSVWNSILLSKNKEQQLEEKKLEKKDKNNTNPKLISSSIEVKV